MPGFDDLIRKAAKIARDEGISIGGDPLIREILPSAPSAKIDKKKAKRIAERLATELGNDGRGAETTANLPSNTGSQPINTIEVPNIQTAIEIGPDPSDVVQEQLDILEEWTVENLQLARRDAIRFWALKLPAIVSSASVAALEASGYGQVVIVLGVVTALCIAIDGLFPGGQLHNIHKRAACETRRLQQDTIIRWRRAQLDSDSSQSLAKVGQAVLTSIQKERTRIDKYVTDAESSLGTNETAPS
jgi:hypothetical protein